MPRCDARTRPASSWPAGRPAGCAGSRAGRPIRTARGLASLTGGLGLIAGSHCPHYDGEPERRPTYRAMVAAGELPAGLAIDDHAAAIFDGPDLVEVVAAGDGPAAYRVERSGDGAVETRLAVRVLAAAG